MGNSVIEVINKHIKNKNYLFLDRVFKNYDNLSSEKALNLLKEALKSDLVKQQAATYTADYPFFGNKLLTTIISLIKKNKKIFYN